MPTEIVPESLRERALATYEAAETARRKATATARERKRAERAAGLKFAISERLGQPPALLGSIEFDGTDNPIITLEGLCFRLVAGQLQVHLGPATDDEYGAVPRWWRTIDSLEELGRLLTNEAFNEASS